MSEDFQEDMAFTAADEAEDEALIVDVGGYEGPLHLLLALARRKKVDLAKISILELAEQYLAFIAEARRRRLDLAADYLVMASWLAYLKSRLLLPKAAKETDEPAPEEMAAALAFRLHRLHAMREAGKAMFRRDLPGRDVFLRGAPEGVRTLRASKYEATLYDLLKAYATRRQVRGRVADYRPDLPKVYGLEAARERLEAILPTVKAWRTLDDLLPDARELGVDPPPRRSVLASATLAVLEVTKEGRAELRQDKAFAPIHVRGRSDEDRT